MADSIEWRVIAIHAGVIEAHARKAQKEGTSQYTLDSVSTRARQIIQEVHRIRNLENLPPTIKATLSEGRPA